MVRPAFPRETWGGGQAAASVELVLVELVLVELVLVVLVTVVKVVTVELVVGVGGHAPGAGAFLA
jgi:hypothetical protein